MARRLYGVPRNPVKKPMCYSEGWTRFPHEERMSKDRKSEDEWFARHEEVLLRQARRDRRRQQSSEAPRTVPCPKCDGSLAEEEVVGVVIDRCSSCQGIFLDRGELEEILLRSAQERRGFFRRLLGLGSD